MTHNKCVDSSILYPHPKGYPLRLKLKELAETHLNIVIQRNYANFVQKTMPPLTCLNKKTMDRIARQDQTVIDEREREKEINSLSGNDKIKKILSCGRQ